MSRSMWSMALLVAAAVIAPMAGAQQPASPAQPAPSGRLAPSRRPRDGAPRVDGPRGRRMPPMGPRVVGMARMAPRGGVASMLLARTAELKLTDAQVTRLAALARTAEAQHQAMRASMDSLHRAMIAARGQGSAMPAMPADMQARLQRMHDDEHANVRDALAVLTPDQLASAWEQHHGMMGMGGAPGGMMRGAAMRHPMDGPMDGHMDGHMDGMMPRRDSTVPAKP